jgi:two-component system cell cycle response regulator
MDAMERTAILRLLQGTALIALVLYALHVLAGLGGERLDGFAQDWLYNGVIAASATLCLARAAMVREERPAWLLLGAGLASWLGGELYYTIHLSQLESAPYPSLSDALYLAFYPASYVALTLLTRRRVREYPASQWVDGIVAALAVAALGSAALLEPVLAGTEGSWLTVATDLAYPLADVILLALIVGTFALSGWRPGRSWALIGTSLVAIAVADGVFLYQAANESYAEGGVLDVMWPAATLLLGFAAWVRRDRVATLRLEGWRTLLVPTAFALTSLGLLVVSEFNPFNEVAVVLAAATLVAVIARMALTFGENLRMLARNRKDAVTDALTGLGNRRLLMEDLEDELRLATPGDPRLLAVFDLDGFKRYNDSFGHPAGDALLARLGKALRTAVDGHGGAYRLGGDEFCVLLTNPGGDPATVIDGAVESLSDRGEGFEVTASHGTVDIPAEGDTPERALRVADVRLYERKSSRQRSAAAQQTRDALLQALQERAPGLRDHLDGVAWLARAVGRKLGLAGDEIDVLVRAAELHDVGKVAVPDEILEKAGPLDDTEWDFVRQHTIVGERILCAAPALAPVAKLVRSSHERYDGIGYPDGLTADEIPLGSRIVAVCDAYHAMTSDRSYGQSLSTAEALAELRRSAGRQFDPAVVDAFSEIALDMPELPEDPSETTAPPAHWRVGVR